jgi:hypothetical protein
MYCSITRNTKPRFENTRDISVANIPYAGETPSVSAPTHAAVGRTAYASWLLKGKSNQIGLYFNKKA